MYNDIIEECGDFKGNIGMNMYIQKFLGIVDLIRVIILKVFDIYLVLFVRFSSYWRSSISG